MITAFECKLSYMTTLSERMKLALSDAGMNQSELARIVGVSSVAVNSWCSGDSKSIKGANLLKAASALRVNPEWLATGRGQMKISAGEVAGSNSAGYASRLDNNVMSGPAIGGEVPVISWVQAGNWQDVVDNYQPGFAEEYVTATVQVNRYTYALRVQGDSMEPVFTEGEVLIVEPEAQPFNGCYAIVKNGDNEATFKKLIKDGGDWYLKPLNPDYPVKPLRDDMRIVGIVRERVTKFF